MLPNSANTIVILDNDGEGSNPVVIGKGAAFTFRAGGPNGYADSIQDLVIDDSGKAAEKRMAQLGLSNHESYQVGGCCSSSVNVNIYLKGNTQEPSKPDHTDYYVLVAKSHTVTVKGQTQFAPDEIWISPTEFNGTVTGFVRRQVEAICKSYLP